MRERPDGSFCSSISESAESRMTAVGAAVCDCFQKPAGLTAGDDPCCGLMQTGRGGVSGLDQSVPVCSTPVWSLWNGFDQRYENWAGTAPLVDFTDVCFCGQVFL